MHVVYLTIHLDQLSLEILAHLLEDEFEPIESIGVEYLFPVLGNEDQVDMKLKNAVSAVLNIT
jgi:hypothetical protein